MQTDTKRNNLRFVANKVTEILRDNGYKTRLLQVTSQTENDIYDIEFIEDSANITNADIDQIKFNMATELGINSLNVYTRNYKGKTIYQFGITNNYVLLKTDKLTNNITMLVLSIQLATELGVINETLLQRRLNLSNSRAKHIIEQMYVMGIIERSDGHSPHKVTIKQSEVDEYKELLINMCAADVVPEHRPDDTRLLRLFSLFNVEADLRVVRRTPTTIILEYSFINEATYRKVKELSTELSMRLNAPSFRIIQGVKYDFGAEIANDELHLLE